MTRIISTAILALCLAACSGHRPVAEAPLEYSEIQGKKVALVEIDGGEPTARALVETALVNQLMARGTFFLLSKQDIYQVRNAPDMDPTDWKGIARRAGADYALKATIRDFTADENTGYSSETVEDSQLKAETGEGRTERLYKVRKLTGHVAIVLEFATVSPREPTRKVEGVAEASDSATAESKNAVEHLPPRLRFLEKVANQAFAAFFSKNF